VYSLFCKLLAEELPLANCQEVSSRFGYPICFRFGNIRMVQVPMDVVERYSLFQGRLFVFIVTKMIKHNNPKSAP
jgi:hypothetical protein